MASSFFDFSTLLAPDSDIDQFAWLQAVAAGLEDKPSTDFVAPTVSPASDISSICSSVNTRHGLDSDSDGNNSNSDSDSEVEQFPLAGTFEQYHVINGVAYAESTLHANDTISQLAGTNVPPRRQTLRNRSHSVIAIDSDDDAVGESDTNASDVDYVPSPLLPRRWPSPALMASPQSHFNSTLPSSHAISTPVTSRRPAKRPRASPPSRNVQTTVLSPDAAGQRGKSDPWACPHCPWIQHNKRTPDLKRHIRTHERNREPPKWVCNGIPFDDPSFHTGGPSPSLYGTGGCQKSFSRRDALKRHLDNRNIGCVRKLNPFHTETA